MDVFLDFLKDKENDTTSTLKYYYMGSATFLSQSREVLQKKMNEQKNSKYIGRIILHQKEGASFANSYSQKTGNRVAVVIGADISTSMQFLPGIFARYGQGDRNFVGEEFIANAYWCPLDRDTMDKAWTLVMTNNNNKKTHIQKKGKNTNKSNQKPKKSRKARKHKAQKKTQKVGKYNSIIFIVIIVGAVMLTILIAYAVYRSRARQERRDSHYEENSIV